MNSIRIFIQNLLYMYITVHVRQILRVHFCVHVPQSIASPTQAVQLASSKCINALDNLLYGGGACYREFGILLNSGALD